MLHKDTHWVSVGVGLAVAGLAALGLLVSPPWDFWVEILCLVTGLIIVVIGSKTPRRALGPAPNPVINPASDEYGRAQAVEIKRQDAIDGLAKLRAVGVLLYHANVSADEWRAERDLWVRDVTAFLQAHFTDAVRAKFLYPDPLPPAEMPDPQGPDHRLLDQQLKYLSSVIERGTSVVRD